MKPTLFAPPHQSGPLLAFRLRKSCNTILAAVVAIGLGAGAAYCQAPPGNFYQVNPPGSGITGATYNELTYVNGFLPGGVSLFNPAPAGQTVATPAQLAAAVTSATQQLITNPGSAPAGVTLASIATQIVANNPAAASASSGSTLSALANAIIANQSSSTAITSLNSVISGLATSYPSTLTSYSAAVFQSAAANSGTATGITQMALTATTAVSGNDLTVGTLVGQALNSAAGSVLASAAKQTLITNVISSELGSSQINSSQASIAAIATSMTTSTVLAAIPISTVLNTAVNALPAKTNASVGAIAIGALVSSSVNATTISSTLASASSGTAGYTNMVVNGFNNSSTAAAYTSYLAANPAYTDAIVSGASVKGVLSPTVLVQDAIQAPGTTVSVQNIVAAAVAADLTRTTSSSPAIAGAAIQAIASPTAANFQSAAQGAVSSARIADAGAISFTLISDSSGFAANTLSAANVQNVVNGALTAAYNTGKQGSISDIVYMAEKASYNTPATLTTPVTQAIASMQALDPSNPNRPTYIAVAGALAGYGGTVTANDPNLTAITTAASAADSRPVAVNAFNAAQSIVNSIRTNTVTAYTTTLNTFSSTSAPDSVLAVFYAASLADPNETSAILGAAVSKSSSVVSNANLLAAAINANRSKADALTIANTVAVHIQTNISNNTNNDIGNYVGYQVAQNPSFVKDIAAVATAVDPNQVNYIARAVAHNSPQTAYTAVSSLFAYSQITSHGQNGAPATPIDMTSAAAAISAGFTTGIIEVQNSPSLPAGSVQTALVNGIQSAVLSAITQNGQALQGAIIAQSTGVNTTSSTNKKSVGAAGVITGFVSQVVLPTDGASLGNSTTLNSTIVDAILKAAVLNGGGAYAIQMAQAAGQAWGYITGHIGGQTSLNPTAVANQIAADFAGSGISTTLLFNSAYFGATQGQSGVVGAGASGVVNYTQHSATGNPVTDIFNL